MLCLVRPIIWILERSHLKRHVKAIIGGFLMYFPKLPILLSQQIPSRLAQIMI